MEQLSASAALHDVISQHQPSLLYFSASWCGPCKSMAPIVEDVSKKLENRINAIKIDVDSHAQDAANYNIRSVPTTILVKNGKVLVREVGGMPADELVKCLEQHI